MLRISAAERHIRLRWVMGATRLFSYCCRMVPKARLKAEHGIGFWSQRAASSCRHDCTYSIVRYNVKFNPLKNHWLPFRNFRGRRTGKKSDLLFSDSANCVKANERSTVPPRIDAHLSFPRRLFTFFISVMSTSFVSSRTKARTKAPPC